MDELLRQIQCLLNSSFFQPEDEERPENASDISSDYDEDSSSDNYLTIKSDLKVVKPLPMYLPSEQIKIASDSNFSSKSLCENHDDVIKTYLKDFKLNENNIHLVLKMLLEIEDITCMKEYVPFVQKDVTLNKSDLDREYWIKLENCPKIEDVVTPLVDEVVLVPSESRLISEVCPLKYETDILLPHTYESTGDSFLWRRTAIVRQFKQGLVYFRLNEHEDLSRAQIASLPTTKYDIIFRSQRYPLRYQLNAIYLLGLDTELRKYLFPTQKPNKELVCPPQLDLNLYNNTIATNPEQLMAVQNIVRGPNLKPPFIIFGPPGTGKTTVVVESILQIFLRDGANRILVTAGSNSACDTIALRLCRFFEKHYNNQKHPMLRVYSKSICEKGIKSIDLQLLKYSNCKSCHHRYPSIEEIHQHRIIVTTLCTVGKLVSCDLGKDNFFTHIFIDEAGASTIPEALVAVMDIKSHSNCRLILSGDHKQLGPILKSERAAKLGLEQSLMEHLLKLDCYTIYDNCNYDPTLQARLKRNYRSHPEILRLFNHLFYNGELIAAAKEEHVNLAAEWCKLPNPKFPIIFQAVHGVTEKDSVSPSSFNCLEIEVVMWFLRRLLNDGINGQKVDETDIGIITPYRMQSKKIQARLNCRGWRNVECGSVETFQGREKQIIIVSLVKSFSGLGFVCNPKRLNVILSRPQSLLILLGNPLSLRRNPDFAFILDECAKHGTFLRKDKLKKPKLIG